MSLTKAERAVLLNESNSMDIKIRLLFELLVGEDITLESANYWAAKINLYPNSPSETGERLEKELDRAYEILGEDNPH